MGYPFILAYNGEHFARVNYDGSWSVDWPKATNVCYEPMTLRNKAIVACAIVLVAAKDNFVLTPWEDSDKWNDKWERKRNVIDLVDSDPPDHDTLFNISLKSADLYEVARVNFDGSWSIKWDAVDRVIEGSLKEWSILAVTCFCRLLKAAQDRFKVVPWSDGEEEDEGDDY